MNTNTQSVTIRESVGRCPGSLMTQKISCSRETPSVALRVCDVTLIPG